MDEPRKHIAGLMSGLYIHYALGDAHPLVGRRMPDLDVQTPGGPTRVFTLLHEARPMLLNLRESGMFDMAPWADRVRLVAAACDGAWELPVVGQVAAPAGGADPARRLRRLGRGSQGRTAARSTDDVVRSPFSAVARAIRRSRARPGGRVIAQNCRYRGN